MGPIPKKDESFERFTGDLERYRKQFIHDKDDTHCLVRTLEMTDKLIPFNHTCGCYCLEHKAIEIVHYTLSMLTNSQIKDKRLIALSKNLCKFTTAVRFVDKVLQVHLLFNFLNVCAKANKNNCFKKLIKDYGLIFDRCIQNEIKENISPHHHIPICKNNIMYLKI